MKMMQIKLSIILIIGLGFYRLQAQESKTKFDNGANTDSSIVFSVQDHIHKQKYRQGFVTSTVAPFIGIYAIAYFHEIKSFNNVRGDILFGAAHQNQKTDDGKFNGISLVIGYRQFLYKKLCITEMFYPNYNHFQSSIDGKTYKGFDGFNEISLGWEFEFKLTKKVSMPLTPQFTYGQALFRTNPWPRHKEELQKIFFPDVYIGMAF
jgi:hypothetical protein